MNKLICLIFLLFFINFLVGCHNNIDLPKPEPEPENPAICYEIITVDFEPTLFTELVQTVPYHIEKEPINNAFVSVKMQTQQIPWVIWFSSEFVTFKPGLPLTISFEDYTGNLGFQVTQSGNLSILETQIWDTIQMSQYLHTYEQIIVDLEIECYNP